MRRLRALTAGIQLRQIEIDRHRHPDGPLLQHLRRRRRQRLSATPPLPLPDPATQCRSAPAA
ncbi:hypothetical protein M8494_03115 [Serratia ureilytica]